VVIWYIFPILVLCTKKNLATLVQSLTSTSIGSVRKNQAVPVAGQGCQIFLGTLYQNRKNVPNEYNMYQMAIKYPKCLYSIPNGHKMYQHIPI
jgi:hypothetical protein